MIDSQMRTSQINTMSDANIASVDKTIIGSNNGLAPNRRQAII